MGTRMPIGMGYRICEKLYKGRITKRGIRP